MSSNDLKSLKVRLTAPAYHDYTGQIGMYQFEDGVSVETLTTAERDRLAASFGVDEILEDGTEQPAGFAARLVRYKDEEASVAAETMTQTAEEKSAEDIMVLLNGVAPKKLLTHPELEAIAAEGGIEKLREIAEPWDVRSRAIVELIAKIEEAQEAYVTNTVAELVAKGVPETDARAIFAADAPAPVEETPAVETPDPEPVEDENQALVDAAASGDMAAALNTPEE